MWRGSLTIIHEPKFSLIIISFAYFKFSSVIEDLFSVKTLLAGMPQVTIYSLAISASDFIFPSAIPPVVIRQTGIDPLMPYDGKFLPFSACRH